LLIAIQKWRETVGAADDHEGSYERPCAQELKPVRQKLFEVFSSVVGGSVSRSEEIDADEPLLCRDLLPDGHHFA